MSSTKAPIYWRYIELIVGVTIIIVALLAIIGNFLNIGILAAVVPGFVSMKILTACMFLVIGFNSIMVFYRKNILIITSILLMSLISLHIGMSLDSRHLILSPQNKILTQQETVDSPYTDYKQLPSLGTMLCFIFTLTGYSCLLTKSYRGFVSMMSLVFCLSLVPIIGYLLYVPILFYYYPAISTAISINTSFLFMIFSLTRLLGNGNNLKLE